MNDLTELGWSQFFQSQLSLEAFEAELPFRVISIQRNQAECLGFDESGQQQALSLSTYPWRNALPEDHPTVGDWLMCDKSLQPLYLLERKTLVKRRSAGRESLVQLIAANIDTLFIVTSANEEFKLNRIERYLTLAAESKVEAVVLVTKSDLCSEVELAVYFKALRSNYPDLAIETLNATDLEDVKKLQYWCARGQTVALVGSSGVGKSTLVNGLKGAEAQLTGAIRSADSKGRHTTTSRSLHQLMGGGLLMDTPGMRELQLAEGTEGIQSVFADIEQLAKNCRFHDCQHISEPACAVQSAVKAGQLEQRRLDNYHKLLAEQARSGESIAERRQQDKALGRFYKQAKNSARQFKLRD